MSCFRYIIVNALHKDDDKNNNINNRFFMDTNVTRTIKGNHRIAATLHTVDKLLISGTEL